MGESYERGTVRRLIESDLVTPPTRRALQARLADPPVAPRFFSEALFATLRAVCDRLLAQDRLETVDGTPVIDIAGAMDRRLAEGKGDGWRYADMPPDGEAYRLGLIALDETSRLCCGATFVELDPAEQDKLLGSVQRGEVTGGAWKGLSPERFFEELLAEAAEIYYSHPLAQEEIGYAGMADARGWQAIGLNELAAHEPAALPTEPAPLRGEFEPRERPA